MSRLFLFLILFFPFISYSQLTSHWVLATHDFYVINPAVAGITGQLKASGIYRDQWNDLHGQPLSQQVSLHFPFYAINSGAGIKIEAEDLGVETRLEIGASYNYILDLNKGSLSLAAGLNFMQDKWDGTELRTRDGIYVGGLINHNDPEIPNREINLSIIDVSLAALYVGSFYEVGLTIERITDGAFTLEESPFYRESDQVITLYSEFLFPLAEGWRLFPLILAKSDLNQYQAEAGARIEYLNRYNMGVYWRGYSNNSLDAAVISAQYFINANLGIGFAYGIGVSDLAEVHSNSLEIGITYRVRKRYEDRLPPIIYHPRAME